MTGVIGWRESNFVTPALPALTVRDTKVNFRVQIKLIWCRSLTNDKLVLFKDSGAHSWQKNNQTKIVTVFIRYYAQKGM